MVSIIVPVYNVEKYLSECVDSLIRQTLRDIEIILVDDGSTDSCGTLCDTFAKEDSRIRVIHKENGGLSSARNAGIATALGEYICFIDSDDALAPSYAETLLSGICKNSADMSACLIKKFSDGEGYSIETEEAEYITVSDKYASAINDASYCGYACNKLFKTDIIKKNSICFDENIYNGEDLPFVCNYLKYVNSAVFTETPLYFYRVRNDSITTGYRKFSKRSYTIVRAREHVLDVFSSEAPQCLERERLSYLDHLLKQRLLILPEKENYPEIFTEIQAKIKNNKKGILKTKRIPLSKKVLMLSMLKFPRIMSKIYRKG